jgi:hypothetical protein
LVNSFGALAQAPPATPRLTGAGEPPSRERSQQQLSLGRIAREQTVPSFPSWFTTADLRSGRSALLRACNHPPRENSIASGQQNI